MYSIFLQAIYIVIHIAKRYKRYKKIDELETQLTILENNQK